MTHGKHGRRAPVAGCRDSLAFLEKASIEHCPNNATQNYGYRREHKDEKETDTALSLVSSARPNNVVDRLAKRSRDG
jgi:hypothetical protein